MKLIEKIYVYLKLSLEKNGSEVTKNTFLGIDLVIILNGVEIQSYG